MPKSSEILTEGEGNDFDLHNNLFWFTVFFWVSPITAPLWLLSLAGDGTEGGGLGHFKDLLSFPEYLPCLQWYMCY